MNITRMTNEEYLYACKNKLIVPYETELIDSLRTITYNGFPTSIIALSFPIHNGQCYATSVILSKGLENFHLIIGNTNEYPIDKNRLNHSWIEKDHYVYDPTDGFKWNKDLYYQLYKPQVVQVYDEFSIQDYAFYHEVSSLLCYDNSNISIELLTIMLQYIECLELEENTLNHTLLLNEIQKCRRMYNVTEIYCNEAIEEFKQYIKTIRD